MLEEIKEIHLSWTGGPLHFMYRCNIIKWAKLNPLHTVNVWTDNAELVFQTQSNIKVRRWQDAFPLKGVDEDRSKRLLGYAMSAHQENHPEIVSNIVRHVLLGSMGGLYVDFDVIPKAALHPRHEVHGIGGKEYFGRIRLERGTTMKKFFYGLSQDKDHDLRSFVLDDKIIEYLQCDVSVLLCLNPYGRIAQAMLNHIDNCYRKMPLQSFKEELMKTNRYSETKVYMMARTIYTASRALSTAATKACRSTYHQGPDISFVECILEYYGEDSFKVERHNSWKKKEAEKLTKESKVLAADMIRGMVLLKIQKLVKNNKPTSKQGKASSDLLRITFRPGAYIRDLWSFSAAMTATNSSGQKLNGSPTEAQNKGGSPPTL